MPPICWAKREAKARHRAPKSMFAEMKRLIDYQFGDKATDRRLDAFQKLISISESPTHTHTELTHFL